ncbi:MAG: hypothetical protein KBC62_04380 [Candidatus Pacebacteria bacterium]|nr:hypothetical protein [Candidatus Paceibacterota bacterium]MBP9843212.1 hypothetical protein [Candidatus Paceibacterota bacterium]
MRKQDMISILITFVVGFIAGGYLYLTHFSKLVAPDSVDTQEEQSEFQIVSQAYGQCGDSCPSFQIANNGTYRYQYLPSEGAEKQFKTGTIPFNITNDIKDTLDVDELVQQSQPVEPANCNSYNNGIDVSYTITYEGAEYTLDSCGTAVNGNSELWNSLAKTWNYFQTIQ